jgi:hypothetical protein
LPRADVELPLVGLRAREGETPSVCSHESIPVHDELNMLITLSKHGWNTSLHSFMYGVRFKACIKALCTLQVSSLPRFNQSACLSACLSVSPTSTLMMMMMRQSRTFLDVLLSSLSGFDASMEPGRGERASLSPPRDVAVHHGLCPGQCTYPWIPLVLCRTSPLNCC